MISPDLRARIDAQHAELGRTWKPFEERWGADPVVRHIPLEMAGPAPADAPAKPAPMPTYIEHKPKQAKSRNVRVEQPRLKRVNGRADKRTCPHEKWRQMSGGEKFERYEQCTRCNKTRTKLDAGYLPRGNKSIVPKQDKATCQHLPEWLRPMRKNGQTYQKCGGCLRVLRSFDGVQDAPRKRTWPAKPCCLCGEDFTPTSTTARACNKAECQREMLRLRSQKYRAGSRRESKATCQHKDGWTSAGFSTSGKRRERCELCGSSRNRLEVAA